MTEDQYKLGETNGKPKRPASKAKGGVIKVETMSLNQFRSYLKGIMFVGGPTWRPDREQWEAIVAIIDKLTVDAPQQPSYANNTPYAVPTAETTGWNQTAPVWQPMAPQQQLPSAMDTVEDDGSYRSPFV